jgi:hypothetical protein
MLPPNGPTFCPGVYPFANIRSLTDLFMRSFCGSTHEGHI